MLHKRYESDNGNEMEAHELCRGREVNVSVSLQSAGRKARGTYDSLSPLRLFNLQSSTL